METKTYNTLEYYEIDHLVNDRFPMSSFNVVADNELNNDSDKDFGLVTKASFNSWNDDIRKEFYDMILGKRNTMWKTNLFLEFLVGMDVIPEGFYLVSVSW